MSRQPCTPVLLYDGNCGLCHRSVRFVLRHDRRGRFRFAPLQGPFARSVLERHGRTAGTLDTVYLWLDDARGDRLLERSVSALETLRLLGPPWSVVAAVARLVPRTLRDRCYDAIAARRYGWFGELQGCPLPSPEHRARFLE